MRGGRHTGLKPSDALARMARAVKGFDTDFDFDGILPPDDDDDDDYNTDKPGRQHPTPSGKAQDQPICPPSPDRVQKM